MNILEKFSLHNQVAVVTGGARGLGFAMGEALLSAGASLVVVDIDKARGERAAATLCERYGRRVEAISADVTSEQAVAEVVETIEQRAGQIDVLFNNAGISLLKHRRRVHGDLSAADAYPTTRNRL